MAEGMRWALLVLALGVCVAAGAPPPPATAVATNKAVETTMTSVETTEPQSANDTQARMYHPDPPKRKKTTTMEPKKEVPLSKPTTIATPEPTTSTTTTTTTAEPPTTMTMPTARTTTITTSAPSTVPEGRSNSLMPKELLPGKSLECDCSMSDATREDELIDWLKGMPDVEKVKILKKGGIDVAALANCTRRRKCSECRRKKLTTVPVRMETKRSLAPSTTTSTTTTSTTPEPSTTEDLSAGTGVTTDEPRKRIRSTDGEGRKGSTPTMPQKTTRKVKCRPKKKQSAADDEDEEEARKKALNKKITRMLESLEDGKGKENEEVAELQKKKKNKSKKKKKPEVEEKSDEDEQPVTKSLEDKVVRMFDPPGKKE